MRYIYGLKKLPYAKLENACKAGADSRLRRVTR